MGASVVSDGLSASVRSEQSLLFLRGWDAGITLCFVPNAPRTVGAVGSDFGTDARDFAMLGLTGAGLDAQDVPCCCNSLRWLGDGVKLFGSSSVRGCAGP